MVRWREGVARLRAASAPGVPLLNGRKVGGRVTSESKVRSRARWLSSTYARGAPVQVAAPLTGATH